MDLGEQTSKRLFEVLADWNAQLEALKEEEKPEKTVGYNIEEPQP